MLALDLGVFHRKAHAITVKQALLWSGFWILLSLLYNAGVYFWRGEQAALEFLTGYLVEKSLSVDNIFVFVLIFSYFRVPEELQHRVLFWGILGALIMRGALIGVGVALMHAFSWIIYVFGAFLIFTGIRMALQKDHDIDIEANSVVKLTRRLMRITPTYYGKSFFIRDNGRTFATPLFLVLILVDFFDLVFAIDSIPAIFAITEDPFIVYTSNVFAILGLRMLYFALAGIIDRFHYLKIGLAVVLVLIGIKMLLAHSAYEIPTSWSLLGVAVILGVAVAASLLNPREVVLPPGHEIPGQSSDDKPESHNG